MSKDDVDTLWEQLLREERYEAIAYLNKRYSAPTTHIRTKDKSIEVLEGRGGYLGGLLGEGAAGGTSPDDSRRGCPGPC